MFKRIVFSKQADHDLDLAPRWLRWYQQEFRVDKILITPVKTPTSEIDQTVEFYRAAGCQVRPIVLPDGWHDVRIWHRQLAMVRDLLPGGDCLVVSADADQLFQPPAALPAGKSAMPFRRLEMVAEGPSRLGVLAESGRGRAYLGAFIGSLDSKLVGITGHWSGPVPSEPVPVEFHLHLRGLAAFRQKVGAVGFDPQAPRGLGYHWRDWQATARAEGAAGVARLYRQETAGHLFQPNWPPELRGKLERLQRFLQGEVAE